MEKTSKEWERLKDEFKEWYFDTSEILTITKDVYQTLINSLLFDQDNITNPQIEGRVKDRKSCIEKIERKYLSEMNSETTLEQICDKITDFIGLRIICSYEDEIHNIEEILIEEILRDNFEVIEKTDKTQKLIEAEKFGYKGIHLNVKFKEDRLKLNEYKNVSNFAVEIQIRTIIQHAWSYLDHKIIYKKEESSDLTRAVERLAALFEIADSEFIRLREATKNQEKISEDKINSIKDKNIVGNIKHDKMDFITFKKFLSMKFDTYNFYEYKTNSMLEEILRSNSDFNLEDLSNAYDEKFEIVQKYKDANDRILSMNPYTMLRHILYVYDKETYTILLSEIQKRNFDDYLKINEISIKE